MSEKPFWEGKTCEEMAGLPVKAVFKNGVTITGQLSRFGGIPISTEGMNNPIPISSNTLNFRPHIRPLSSQNLRRRQLQRLPVRHEPQTSQAQMREVCEA